MNIRTVEDPGHLVDKDVVEAVGRVQLEHVDRELDELHVQVLEARVFAVHEPRDLLALLLSGTQQKPIIKAN